jgi:succinate dehydrogenase/fumarate reductase flavoprotein subunit
LRPTGRVRDVDPREVVRQAQAEILPYDKNLFRRRETLSHSLVRLDRLWLDLREGLAGDGAGSVAAREAAAVVATSRWSYAAALGREVSLGMHIRDDAAARNDGHARSQRVGGLDAIWTRFAPERVLEGVP